jgi:phosphohistidine phosphatase
MRLYLMRHGEAYDAAQDPQRRLTPEGAARIERIGRALAGLGLRFDLVVSSPKARARQTAELAADGPAGGEVVETDVLTPNAPPEETLAFLTGRPGPRSVLAVGHLPSLGRVAALILGGRPGCVQFEAGAVCCLELARPESGQGVLVWKMATEHLESLALGRATSA